MVISFFNLIHLGSDFNQHESEQPHWSRQGCARLCHLRTWHLLSLEVHKKIFSQRASYFLSNTAAFSSNERRVLIKYVVMLLLWYSNANIIVVPRGLERGTIKLYTEQTQPWALAKESASQAQDQSQHQASPCNDGAPSRRRTQALQGWVHTCRFCSQISIPSWPESDFSLSFSQPKGICRKRKKTTKSYRTHHKSETRKLPCFLEKKGENTSSEHCSGLSRFVFQEK